MQDVQKKSGIKSRVKSLMVAWLRSKWSKVSLTQLSITTGLSVKNTPLFSSPISICLSRLLSVTICAVTVSPDCVKKLP